MYFGSDKIGKIQFFHLLVEVARELIMLWLSTLWNKRPSILAQFQSHQTKDLSSQLLAPELLRVL